MSPPSKNAKVESKAEAEALIPLFEFQRILNQDQNGRRMTLLGAIKGQPAVFTLERAAFPSNPIAISSLLVNLANTTNLGANDIYRWYMSNQQSSTSSSKPNIPDLKLNLIWPCTPNHIRKYTSQPLRYVTETSMIYKTYVKPYLDKTQRTPARLDWIFNILDGITEQEDVIYRSPDFISPSSASSSSLRTAAGPPAAVPTGFLLLPDLNWDRKTLSGLHLLALPQRRDISSIRDLRGSHVPWLRNMLEQIKIAAAQRGTQLANENRNRSQSGSANQNENVDQSDDSLGEEEVMEPDQVKCYVHYHPTYYHFHVHVVHVMLEAEGSTQSVGKAWGLETIIALLEGLNQHGGQDIGLDDIDLAYHVGEESDLWRKCFKPIKSGEKVDLID